MGPMNKEESKKLDVDDVKKLIYDTIQSVNELSNVLLESSKGEKIIETFKDDFYDKLHTIKEAVDRSTNVFKNEKKGYVIVAKMFDIFSEVKANLFEGEE